MVGLQELPQDFDGLKLELPSANRDPEPPEEHGARGQKLAVD